MNTPPLTSHALSGLAAGTSALAHAPVVDRAPAPAPNRRRSPHHPHHHHPHRSYATTPRKPLPRQGRRRRGLHGGPEPHRPHPVLRRLSPTAGSRSADAAAGRTAHSPAMTNWCGQRTPFVGCSCSGPVAEVCHAPNHLVRRHQLRPGHFSEPVTTVRRGSRQTCGTCVPSRARMRLCVMSRAIPNCRTWFGGSSRLVGDTFGWAGAFSG